MSNYIEQPQQPGGALVNKRLLNALRLAERPLIRLGDFVGNVDKGGASGLGEFDRCAIVLEVRSAIAEAEKFVPSGNLQNEAMSAEDKGMLLRTKALALLQEAQAVDGLKPFTVNHTHSFGESTYVLWAADKPTQEEAVAVLDSEFEPEREETLVVEDCFTLEEMTGVSLTARLQDILDNTESPCRGDTPSP